MRSKFDDTEAAEFTSRYRAYGEDVALRVYTSRLLGTDPTLVLHGGGNTSVKTTMRSRDGAPVEALVVKGSGWDLATIEPEGFPACRLDELWKLCALDELSDDDMVAGLRGSMLDPESPTPSVEALLHAYLPAKFVDHTHSDAVLAVLDQPSSAEPALEVWGPEAFFVPYVMPGFALARRIVELRREVDRQPEGFGRRFETSGVLLLDKHGIFTWGPTARESYELMISSVTLAEQRVVRARASIPPATTRVEAKGAREANQARWSPILRGGMARGTDARRLVVRWRDDEAILELLRRENAERLSGVGPATPDHVIRTKATPLWLGAVGERAQDAAAYVDEALADYARRYEEYFARGASRTGRDLRRLDALPRLAAVPGVGVACFGRTTAEASVVGDVYAHTARIIMDASALGEYRPVDEADLFDVEYWSLEQAKLARSPAPAGSLSDRIAWVTGAASGIGRATAEHFLELGAHVLATDIDEDALARTSDALRARFGPRFESARSDVTDAASVRDAGVAAVRAFGGLDIVVSNAGTAPSGPLHDAGGEARLRESLEVNLIGHQRVAGATVDVFLAQGIGGCLLFNASKAAFDPGPSFGPYTVAKASVVALMRQLAIDLGSHRIRANAVNADRVATNLFGHGKLEERARARGLTPEQYFRANLLARETTARDVAEAFAWLARAEATTGAVVPVDGGNPAAFPR